MTAHAVASTPVVETLTTARGVDLWLVRVPGLPLAVLEFGCHGGAARDPAGAAGAGHLLSGMLDEGAGSLDSAAFQTALADSAISLRFTVSRDEFHGSMRCLARHTGEAFRLLTLAVNEPHFAADATDRVKGQILAGLKRDMQSPEARCRDLFNSTGFAAHPYGQPVKGTVESVEALSPDVLRAQMPRVLHRKGLKLVLVADMAASEAAALVDAAFGALPEGDDAPPPATMLTGLGQRRVIEFDVPQTVIRFGGPGLMRHDPDFIAATVVNHVLGGSAFTSRLFQEVREKRGLAYGVSSSLTPLRAAALHAGGTATKNERALESVEVIEAELAKLAATGPTPDELKAAVEYLTGSYPLRFDTSSKIAAEYLHVATDGFGPEYIRQRNGLFHAVTAEDAARAAQRLYGGGKLLVAAVGKPVGLRGD